MARVSHDSETPAHGQQVIAVCAFVHKDFDGVQKVFMPRRAATKKFFPNVFELPGGHVDFGEDTVAALKREVREELDMSIKVGDPFYVFTYFNSVKGSHSIEVIYFAEFVGSIENIRLEPEDHSEYMWVAADDLNRVIGVGGKNADDPEFLAIKKGFAIINGETLKLA